MLAALEVVPGGLLFAEEEVDTVSKDELVDGGGAAILVVVVVVI